MTTPLANVNYSVGTGGNSTSVFITQLQTRDPSVSDVNYPITKRWVNTNTGKEFILVSVSSISGASQANWINLTNGTAGSVDTLSGNSGTNPVFSDGSSNINVFGDSTSIDIDADAASHTLTASVLLPAQYNVLASNVTSISGIAPSTSGFVLTSNGAAMPTFQAAAGSSLAMAAFGAAPNANAGTIGAGTLTLQPANATNPGGIALGAQTLGSGTKTFTSSPILPLTGMVLGNGASALSAIALTDGQLVIGSTSGPPIAASLMAGTGISITPGANTITISSNDSGITWTAESLSFTAAANHGYIINATLNATLPASPSIGDTISFITFGGGASVLTILANTGQTISIGSAISSTAGNCRNTALKDSITLICTNTNQWTNLCSPQGNWILT